MQLPEFITAALIQYDCLRLIMPHKSKISCLNPRWPPDFCIHVQRSTPQIHYIYYILDISGRLPRYTIYILYTRYFGLTPQIHYIYYILNISGRLPRYIIYILYTRYFGSTSQIHFILYTRYFGSTPQIHYIYTIYQIFRVDSHGQKQN